MKRLKNLYDKILNQIENDDIKIIVKESIVVARNLFTVLIIILLGFIFLPSFEWGWLDRGVMISSISTLIGGLFGLIAGVIGIAGTYGAFYLGVKEEKDKDNDAKDKEKDFELEMLQKLLEYTLEETNVLAMAIVDKYVGFYEEKEIIEVLYKRYEESDLIFYRMLEEILTTDRITSIGDRAKDYLKSRGITEFSKSNLYINVKNIDESDIDELYSEIQGIFIDNYNFNDLVYTDEWYKYIMHIKDNKEYTHTDRKDIINWINYLNSNSIEYINQRVQTLEEKFESLFAQGKSMEYVFLNETIDELARVQMVKIMQFIEYRDNIIDILSRIFKDYEVEYNLLSSTDYIVSEKLKK